MIGFFWMSGEELAPSKPGSVFRAAYHRIGGEHEKKAGAPIRSHPSRPGEVGERPRANIRPAANTTSTEQGAVVDPGGRRPPLDHDLQPGATVRPERGAKGQGCCCPLWRRGSPGLLRGPPIASMASQNDPAPSPSSTRPRLSTSKLAAAFASIAGGRRGRLATSGKKRTLCVLAAR